MLNKEQLQEKADAMNAYLEKPFGSEPNDLIGRMEFLGIMIAQSGKLLAEAGYIKDTIIHSEIMKAVKEGYAETLTPTALNKLISSLAKEENKLVMLFDRINSTASKQLDSMRSVLSYRKAEFSV